MAKTTYRMHADEVYEIKRLLWIGELYQTQIAEKFNTSQSFISGVKRGKVWRHIEFKPTDEDRTAREHARVAHKADLVERRKETKRKANQKYYPQRLAAMRVGREVLRERAQQEQDKPA